MTKRTGPNSFTGKHNHLVSAPGGSLMKVEYSPEFDESAQQVNY